MALNDQKSGNRKGFFDTLRYVEDFKTEEVKDAKGRIRKVTTYIGTWNAFRETGNGTLLKLIGSALLAAAAAVSAMLILLKPHGFGNELVVMIPFMVLLLPMLYLLMGAISLPYRRKPMRRDQYMHGMIRMQRSAVAVIAFAAVGVLSSLVFRIIRGDWLFLKEDKLFLLYAALIILCAAGILALLGSIELSELPNGAYSPDVSADVRS